MNNLLPLFNLKRALLLVCVMGSLALPTTFAANTYHYKDNNGVSQIGYSIPPEFVANGYQIRNESGVVILDVPSKKEIDAKAEAAQAQAAREYELKLQRQRDESLLRYYSSQEDIERVRKRRLEEFDNFVAIQRGNILSYKSRIEALQRQAANIERAGRTVPQSIVENIHTLENNVHDAEAVILAKKEERSRIDQAFQADINRINQLLNPDQAEASLQ